MLYLAEARFSRFPADRGGDPTKADLKSKCN